MRTLPGGALKKLAEFLTPAVLGGNIPCLSTFRTMHSSFSRDPMLLDDLLTRPWSKSTSLLHSSCVRSNFFGSVWNIQSPRMQHQKVRDLQSGKMIWEGEVHWQEFP
ncbi:hypothetical protein HJG60_011471 [Phyllostomus discolor]|uniref:Uncharacterized protein n=1 Tax=Phyllostomus discolor TaxID=89673 RepID=A0A834E0S7_9CHIR|nr:hypothetical protein HJG60_011471 [Phyllostomus discolor]